MKPSRHLRHPAQSPRFAQPVIAACACLLALGLSCSQAAASIVIGSVPSPDADTLVVNAGALNVTPPAAPDDAALAQATQAPAGADRPDADRKPAAGSAFEHVLREQDPAEVPLSLALMGGVLGMLFVRRRKR